MTKKLIIISGMHRSSTSLITQYLQLCGVSLGNNLIGAFKDNKDGYFENSTIVKLHQRLIIEKNLNLFNCKMQTTYSEESKTIIRTEIETLKLGGDVYGFKDPRNLLFIQPLTNLLPNAKHILIYRCFEEVIDSLIRRATDVELKKKPWLAAQAWIAYNSSLIEQIETNKKDCILFKDTQIISESIKCVQLINSRFNINLRSTSIEQIYKPNLTKRDGDFTWKTKLISYVYKRIIKAISSKLALLSSLLSA